MNPGGREFSYVSRLPAGIRGADLCFSWLCRTPTCPLRREPTEMGFPAAFFCRERMCGYRDPHRFDMHGLHSCRPCCLHSESKVC